MQHIFYSDGDTKKISWTIQTENAIVKQNRKHAEMFLDKVSSIQSKYIALHVGLFWGIGTHIIKKGDVIILKLDDKSMYEHLALEQKSTDNFIEKRTNFIKQLISQRKLEIHFKLIPKEKESEIESNTENN